MSPFSAIITIKIDITNNGNANIKKHKHTQKLYAKFIFRSLTRKSAPVDLPFIN